MGKGKSYKLGILAYGSLIDDPGEEISEFEIDRIECETPFNVEFARISSTRSNAPTLIPFKDGLKVRAVIIVLSEKIDIPEAKTILWRREIHNVDGKDNYFHTETYNENKVVVETLNNFMTVETVLYTSIGNNIKQLITGDLLADYAINSILHRAGQEEKTEYVIC